MGWVAAGRERAGMGGGGSNGPVPGGNGWGRRGGRGSGRAGGGERARAAVEHY